MLTGRDGQKVLKFVNNNPNYEIKFRDTLISLYKLTEWASVEKYKGLFQSKKSAKSHLDELVSDFSNAWRKDKFPLINKLHLIESHLVDFIIKHGGWGMYGEQGKLKWDPCLNFLGIESLHRMGNAAEKCCIGVNKNKGLGFFMKVNLILAISNTSMMLPPIKKDYQPQTFFVQDADEEGLEEENNEDVYVNIWDDEPVNIDA